MIWNLMNDSGICHNAFFEGSGAEKRGVYITVGL